MLFKFFYKFCLFSVLASLLACSDPEDETNLVNLYTVASLDIISINFPADSTETIISINSQFVFQQQGLKSNGVDSIDVSKYTIWSLSPGALSKIDRHGLFTAAPVQEYITLTAQIGHLTQSIDIKISAAKFDKVIGLNPSPLSIDMCRSQIIKPVARYVDEFEQDEIRLVDSQIINKIEWIIRESSDNSLSQRAHIKTPDNLATLHPLAAGDLIIQAKAFSNYSQTEITSDDFNQSISNQLLEFKLCKSNATNLETCTFSSEKIEQDSTLSLLATGRYQADDGSSFNENISNNTKWGVDNTGNATIALDLTQKKLLVTGKAPDTSANISAACGDIVESIASKDISQGVVLDTPVTCSNNTECLTKSAKIDISKLSVTSLEVIANDLELVSNIETAFSLSPAEITLEVTANYANSTQAIISDSGELIYTITTIEGQGDVVEPKTDSPGVFTVLGKGIAKIQLQYRQRSFIAWLKIP